MKTYAVIRNIGLILTIFTFKVIRALDCPDGFVTHQGVCYKEFAILASWEEAKTYCAAYGAGLATVADDLDETFLAGYLQRLTHSSFNSGIFWLGGTDMGTEGSWRWDKTGSALTFTHWKTGEPNNAGSVENCLTMSFSDNFFWNDNNCQHKYNFVCEIRENNLAVVG